jgi:transglutaminase-like putative cysteine protease
MNWTTGSRFRASLFASLLSFAVPFVHADQWTAPTPEELSMTSQPEVPGAAAVYLYREEKTDDDMHVYSIYVRLKVLTEKGKEYANVELPYAAGQGGVSVTDIAGRTIHPDGTVVPFTGKPYDKLIEKTRGMNYKSKVFTLPDVEVGSIIEYSYRRRLDDNYFMAPSWFIQTDLFTRKAHYTWKPTAKQLVSSDDRGQLTSSVAWFPVLPPTADFKNAKTPGTNMNEAHLFFELNVHDVPPVPDEEYMPPTSSLTFRVLFYYSPYRTGDEYWKSEGKHWAKLTDKFIGSGSAVRAAVQELITPSDTQDQKLRKLYAAVMKLENTDFTREHTTSEEKSQGLKDVHNADDILTRKRGSSDQLTELFVSMARAAGLKAYVALVASRDRDIFIPAYLSFRQFDDYIAIVNVDGKEQYFDPGSRFCPYQQLAWKHTMAGGIRQVDGGSALITTPPKPYTQSRVQRVANLTMDEQGVATGTVNMTFIGDPAIRWRQTTASGDASSLDRELHDTVEHLLPQGMDIKVATIAKLDDYESPLVVTFNVKGPIGSPTGKRLLFTGDLFETNSKPSFPHEKRESSVYFHYSYFNQDAVRVNFPPVFSVESLPIAMKQQFKTYALYSFATESTPTSVTVRRNYTLGEIFYLPNDYPDLRAFYNKFETKDQESVVLTVAPPASAKSTTATN